MGTLVEDGNALRAALATISGLHAHWLWPDVMLVPAAVVVPAQGLDVDTFDGQGGRTFRVYLLGAAAKDGTYRGQANCLPYLEESGAKSLRAALEADPTLGGKVDDLKVLPWRAFDALKDWAGNVYWGAVYEVEVLA
jgi:hypothetical protein